MEIVGCGPNLAAGWVVWSGLELVAAPFIVFPVFFLPWNPNYPALLAIIVGSIGAFLCRPDRKRKTWVGGLLFTGFYWVFVEALDLLSPGYVQRVWNLADLSGVLILATPLEELAFAFTFGMFWAGVYEHFTWWKSVAE